MLNAYWLSDETLPQAVSLKDIYGSNFSDHEFGHHSRESHQFGFAACLGQLPLGSRWSSR